MRHCPRWRAITTALGISATVAACGDDSGGFDRADGTMTADGTTTANGSTTADGTTTVSDGTTTGATTSTTGGSTDGTGGGTMGNAAPTPTDDALFADEDTTLVGPAASGLLTNDTDPDGDPLTVSTFDGVSVQAGTVTVDLDGGFTYTPPSDFHGDDSFTYTVDDGQGATTVANVAITVGPVNDAPVAVDDVYIVADNATPLVLLGPSGVLANDTDVDGDALTATFDAVSGAGGTVAGSVDGGLSYTPPSPFWGEDLFGYVVDDGNGGTASGQVRAIVSPTAIPLSATTVGVGGFALDGETAGDWSGHTVSAAGDVNGDGLDDVIVGALIADPNGLDRSGRSYVVFGKADTTALLLSDITAGMGGFVIDGEAVQDESGRSVSAAGDVNDDGLDDIIVGAYRADPNGSGSGRSYVVFGKADTAAVQLSSITAGTGGFAMDGEATGDESGHTVSAAGDVNGDGLDDVVVGAHRADPTGSDSGRSYVVFGKTDTATVLLSNIAAGTGGFILDGEAAQDQSGYSVSAAGDVNGDGLGDVVVGAFGADPNGSYSGRSYVVFGKTGTTAVQLSDIAAGMGGFVLDGEAVLDQVGLSVSAAGDVNSDGLDDIVVGAFGADPNGPSSGRSYVVFGKADTTAVPLSTIAAGMGGFVVDGEGAAERSGRSVSAAGDVDGDGVDDIVVGAPGADPNGSGSGRSYVVFGKADTTAVSLSNIAAGMGGFALDGESAGDRSGYSVSAAGDVNGDGLADIIVGAFGADPNGSYAGRSYVVFGGNFSGP